MHIEVFKSSAIKFIPILDSENRIVNLITKQQMHSLLLLDIILGDIHIGNNAKIGAGALVLTDVPEGCTAVGVPIRIIKKEGE